MDSVNDESDVKSFGDPHGQHGQAAICDTLVAGLTLIFLNDLF